MVQYRFFGGKGGVGKTTCAAAFALASARSGRRTLLVSTDPAPSVGDALRQSLSTAPRRVTAARAPLYAVELEASSALARWLGPRRATLETIALRGTWLDQEDVSALLGLSLPGIDEVAALIEIGRLGASDRYDHIVVDTAPTGHTLRMLATPELLQTLAVVFDRMQGKHRAMVEALTGRWTPEESDALIASLDDEGRGLAELLRDRKRLAMSWVTLPEPMAVAETGDALGELRRLGVRVDAVVINRITPAPGRRCRWCAARRAFERAAIETLLEDVVDAGTRIATIAARAAEPRGAAALAGIGVEMAATPRMPRRGARAGGASSRARAPVPTAVALGVMRGAGRTASGERETALSAGVSAIHSVHEGTTLLLFGGKGGVGKTTCAAAAAIALAAGQPRRSVLLLSSDPAHSLADVLGVPLGDEPRRIAGAPPNLKARELDATARFDAIKGRYRSAIDALFGRLVRGRALDASADRQAMRDLMELAPPGVDELIAMVEVADALEPRDTTPGALVVLDTAPSGHALRLLEMPAIVHDWVKALMGIVLKYQPVAGIGELGAVLLQMSQGLGRLRALLADPARTAFLAVTRPAELPAAETARLIGRLRALGINVPAVVVNAVGAGTCSRCLTLRRGQQRAMEAIRKASRRELRTVFVAPAVMPPPHGPVALRKWHGTWTVLN